MIATVSLSSDGEASQKRRRNKQQEGLSKLITQWLDQDKTMYVMSKCLCHNLMQFANDWFNNKVEKLYYEQWYMMAYKEATLQ